MVIELKDLDFICYGIHVKKITEKMITENNCSKIENRLFEDYNIYVKWVNVEETGYLVLSFNDMFTEKFADVVIKIVNEVIKK